MRLSGDNLCVVLVEPSLPENVGSVARAMNNMGVTRLRLVQPCDHLNAAARQLAAHSQTILDTATVYPSLPEAVADQQLIIGTSARIRDRQTRVMPLSGIHPLIPVNPCNIALVFGRENSGLTNAELSVCHHAIHIVTHGQSSSLNLSHSVMVTLYELSKLYAESFPRELSPAALAPSKEIERLKHHFFELLREIRFVKQQNEETLWNSFSDMIGRARLTRLDVRLLRGFFHRVEVTLRRRS